MNPDPLDANELKNIAAVTLAHYEQNAEDFRTGTRDHDVSQNIAALLRHIQGEPPFAILDFGCGPGRDLKTLKGMGHIAIGLDGSTEFAAMAHTDTGYEIWQQDFLKLDLPAAHFDGIFANASLFHVPSRELPRILRQIQATLKPGGVLFSSGTSAWRWNGFATGSRPGLSLKTGGFTTMKSGRIQVCSTLLRRNSAGVAKSVRQPGPRISRSNWSDKTSQVIMDTKK